MVQVIVVIRELGKQAPDYSLPFELPEVPAVGAYLSITRTGDREPFSEDVVVRHVWWRLKHPENDGVSFGEPKVGSLTEIFLECDMVEGPYSNDQWRASAVAARARGVDVPTMEISRFSVPESALSGTGE